MSKLTNIFSDIAEAIRSQTGTSDAFKPSQMASAISEIPSGGSEVSPYAYANDQSISVYSGNEKYVLDNAFIRCSNLIEVSFPKCTYIGDYTFPSCSLTSILSFPECSYIGNNAFAYCRQLSLVSFPKCSYIGSGAFTGCWQLASVSFPECSYIANNAFQACSQLTSVFFPKCSYIGDAAFGGGLFDGCPLLTSVSFPECRYIGEFAFAKCTSLQQTSFPKCSYIGNYAFQSCTQLSQIAFPNPNFSYIEKYAFRDCQNLSWLYLLTIDVPSLANSNAFNSSPLSAGGSGSIYVQNDLVSSFKTADNWSYLSNRIYPVSVPNYGYNARFSLTSYTGGELAIGSGAFCSCYSLTTVSFPKCSYIGDWAFTYCRKLTSVFFPKCEYIGSYAFNGCTQSITCSFPCCSYIGNYAFSAFSFGTNIYLGSNSVVTLGGSEVINPSYRQSVTFYVPSSLYASYQVAPYWSDIISRVTSY